MRPEKGMFWYNLYMMMTNAITGLFSPGPTPSTDLRRYSAYVSASRNGKVYGSTDSKRSTIVGGRSLITSANAELRASATSAAFLAFLAFKRRLLAASFSSRISNSNFRLNSSTPRNSAGCRDPSPLSSNACNRAFACESVTDDFKYFSRPSLSSSAETDPSLFVSNELNTSSVISDCCCFCSASSSAASAL